MDEEQIKQQLAQQQMEKKNAETALQQISLKVLGPKARERLNNLKIVKPELAIQLQLYLAQLYESGQLPGKINEEQLKQILTAMTQKRDIQIKRK